MLIWVKCPLHPFPLTSKLIGCLCINHALFQKGKQKQSKCVQNKFEGLRLEVRGFCYVQILKPPGADCYLWFCDFVNFWLSPYKEGHHFLWKLLPLPRQYFIFNLIGFQWSRNSSEKVKALEEDQTELPASDCWDSCVSVMISEYDRTVRTPLVLKVTGNISASRKWDTESLKTPVGCCSSLKWRLYRQKFATHLKHNWDMSPFTTVLNQLFF